jgi:hypothetical protein
MATVPNLRTLERGHMRTRPGQEVLKEAKGDQLLALARCRMAEYHGRVRVLHVEQYRQGGRSMKRKYKYPTRQEAENAAENAQRTTWETEVCLYDMIEGKVQWHRKGCWKIGLVRPTGAAGGYVIIVQSFGDQSPATRIQAYETWNANIRRWISTCGPRQEKEDQDYLAVHDMVVQSYAAAWAAWEEKHKIAS